MNLLKYEPGILDRRFPVAMDRFFDSFWRSVPSVPALDVDLDFDNGAIAPRMDVVEQDKNFLVTAELPGIPKENIEVTVEDGMLTIRAHVERETKEEKKGDVIHQERYEGNFMRRLDLGAQVTDKGIDAKLKDGVLKITIPKEEGRVSKPTKIKIN